jgi:hypothetical protein
MRLPAVRLIVGTRRRETTDGRKMDAPMSSSQPGGDYDLSNPLNSFVEVVRRVVRGPSEFFSSIPRGGNLLAPLVFAMICIEISTILGGLLRLHWWTRAIGGFRFEGQGYGLGDFLGSVIAAPIVGAIGLFILAGIAHLLVMLFVSSENAGFASTFRVVSYVSVTSLVNWIPFIGGLLGLYGLYLAVVGIREMHSTTTGRAALVVLVPIGLILVAVLLVALVAGAFFLGRLS